MQMHLAADRHATLVLEDDFDPELSLTRSEDAGATLLGGAPVIVERLMGAADRRDGGGLLPRTLALGGSMLPRPLLERATGTYGCEIARVYGSSEAPNFTGSLPSDGPDQRLLDDGALMPGSEVLVGSSDDPREALLRGPGLFLGYLDPADEAAAFAGGWYRTGDLVEVEDGRLTVVGRLKEIVNRNGLKVSLAEIDAALADLPGAVECAAFGAPDLATGERVVVAVVPDGRTEVTFDRLLSHLSDRGVAVRKLPEELVVWSGPLPRTTSGKVVRPRLLSESAGMPRWGAARLREGQT
jgi:acyl-CoA synthetase (AMP-forming)/AMP-acid ligase II